MTADVAEAEGLHTKKLSGTKFRQMLRSGGWVGVGAGSAAGRRGGHPHGAQVLPGGGRPRGSAAADGQPATRPAKGRRPATCLRAAHLCPAGDDIPEWFAFKSVVEVLREHQQHQPQ